MAEYGILIDFMWRHFLYSAARVACAVPRMPLPVRRCLSLSAVPAH